VVAEEIRSLAERTARSTREIAAIVRQTRGHVDTAVVHVKEGRERATAGVALGDRAASALKEIRGITQRTFSAVEATVAETGRLETQGSHVVKASARVAARILELTRASVEQADAGRDLVRQTQEMARLAQGASAKAEGQARTGRALSDAVHRLTDALTEIRAAHAVLTRGDAAISEDVTQVRTDAETVLRIGDGLSRSVEQLSREASSLQGEVFRFRLPEPRRGGTLRVGIHQSAMFRSTRGLDPLFTLDNQMVEIGASIYAGLLRQEDGVMLPELAERWEAAPSARSYRFMLRPRLTFHDQTPLRAEDVKRHFERLLDPKEDSPDQWIFKEVEGARDFLAGKARSVSGFEVLDPLTLEIRLEEPKAFFLHLVTLPATLVTKRGADGRFLGAGPYRPVSLEERGVVLERYPAYFRSERPFLDRLEFHFHADRAEALKQLQAGALDVVSGLYAEHVQAAAVDPQQVIAGSQPSCWFMASTSAPTLRRRSGAAGLRAGLDVVAMVERFHPGRGWPGRSPPSLLTGEPLPTADQHPPGAAASPRRGRGTAPAQPGLSPGAEHRGRGRRPLPPPGGGGAGGAGAHRDRAHRVLATRARGAAAHLSRRVDRRLPRRRQLPPLPAQLRGADGLRAGVPQRRAGPAHHRGPGEHRSRVAHVALPKRGTDRRAGVPGGPAVPRADLRRGQSPDSGVAAASHPAPGALRRVVAGRRGEARLRRWRASGDSARGVASSRWSAPEAAPPWWKRWSAWFRAHG
jgi:hypothetical protein